MTEPTTAATEFPPNRPDIHTLSECRGGGCQAVHIDSLGWPIDAESAAVGRLTRYKSGEWLCAHGRYYLCCDEPNCPYRNERVRNDQPATAARHWHLIGRHVHPHWHGHCDPAKRGYKRCDRPHWHFLWRHRHAD